MVEAKTTQSNSTDNPYQAPQEFIQKALGAENLASRGIITVAVAAVLFGFMCWNEV